MIEPFVPDVDVIDGTDTRMPSYGVSWYRPPDGVSIAVVSVMAVGIAAVAESTVTVGDVISVAGVLLAVTAG